MRHLPPRNTRYREHFGADAFGFEELPEDAEQEIFFMSVTPLEGDEVEFNPVDDELSQELFDAYTSEDEDEE